MIPYFPGLRFKFGEYWGMACLASDLRPHVTPRFVVPPTKEYDFELARRPSIDELAHLTGSRIGKHWPVGRAFLDTRHVGTDLGLAGLVKLFSVARSSNPEVVPAFRLPDLDTELPGLVLHSGHRRAGLVVGHDQVDAQAIERRLKAANLDPSLCTIFLDFTGAVLEPSLAAGSVAAIFDAINEIGIWEKVVFQGSNFPLKNPATPGETKKVPRHEWDVFHKALAESTLDPGRVAYGDFAADNGRMAFPRGKGGGRAIRHLRYTTPDHTLVFRGKAEGDDHAVLKDICQRILDSGQFAGQAFSVADDAIFCVANDIIGPGNASMWRAWNTIHHVTRVVRDLGSLDGRRFSTTRVTRVEEQATLFEEEAAAQ